MNKVFNITSVFKAAEENVSSTDQSITITGLASTDCIDRAGDIILKTAWMAGIDNYRKNPIILFNHCYDEPIGKAIDIRVTDAGLQITAKISTAAEEVYQLIKEGILTTFSVGFTIKDADYNKATDGLIIKAVELYEISVVSVPCNQDATFSVAKSNEKEYKDYKSVYLASHSLTNKEVKTSRKVSGTPGGARAPMENKKMDPEELKALVEKTARDTADVITKAAEEKRAAEVAVAAAAAEKAASEKAAAEAITGAVSSGMTLGAERLYADIAEKMSGREADMNAVLEARMTEIKEAQADLLKMRDSKKFFGDRNTGDWKSDKSMYQDVEDAYILGLVSGKGFQGTKFGAGVVEKVNAHSGIAVSSANFEQEVMINVERDIQLQLVLAPLFREIALRSATQIIPILPDAGYAEITGNQVASGSNPNGSLEARGATYGSPFGGVALTDVTLSTVKMISQSYLGQETEEDAILPILPLIREQIIRSHARGVENAMLLGNFTDGVYTSGAFNGLVKIASTSSRNIQSATAFASELLTGAQLLSARKNMGKYGVNPDDVIYIVSMSEYYNLLKDSAFADWNQVQNSAIKMTGEVGKIYGSRVIVCDEFAAPAVSKHYAVAVNTRNFLVPRLRGMRMESQYLVANQSTVVTATQRIGFTELISGATAVTSLQYKAT